MLLCTSCSTIKTQQGTQNNYANGHWAIKGKLGFKHAAKSGSAFITWNNIGENYVIRLYGAFGMGSKQLSKTGNTITLQSDGKKVSARSPEQLLDDVLGWSFPISEFAYWARGLPSPLSAVNHIEYSEHPQLVILEQQGWRIRYAKYKQVQSIMLPHKIIATRDQVRLVLAIKAWEFKALHNES